MTPETQGQPYMLGIDEAGRGPVLGPMVYAVAWAPISRTAELEAIGFADSKVLSADKRGRLFQTIQARPELLGHQADVLSASFISGKMLNRDRSSLNELAFQSTCRLVEAVLATGVNLTHAYIDALGDTTKHKERLSRQFPGVHFVVEAKADATFAIVSAASIVAKETRDGALRGCLAEEAAALAGGGAEVSAACGSGYPADPDTKRWLEASVDRTFGFPAVVRFSWATVNPLLEQHAAVVKFACDEEADAGQAVLPFHRKAVASHGTGRHSYFRARKLQRAQLAF